MSREVNADSCIRAAAVDVLFCQSTLDTSLVAFFSSYSTLDWTSLLLSDNGISVDEWTNRLDFLLDSQPTEHTASKQ